RCRVVVTACDQRGARGRAKCCGVNVVVAQPAACDAIHRWSRDDASEGARYTESRVIGNDEQDVGSVFGRYDARRPPGFGREGVVFNRAAECWIRRGKLVATDRGGGPGRSDGSGGLNGGACWHRSSGGGW